MKRIDIRYGGSDYSIANRDIADVRSDIAAGLEAGSVFWLEVNEGAGVPRPASLALTVGTPIALSGVPDSADVDGTAG